MPRILSAILIIMLVTAAADPAHGQAALPPSVIASAGVRAVQRIDTGSGPNRPTLAVRFNRSPRPHRASRRAVLTGALIGAVLGGVVISAHTGRVVPRRPGSASTPEASRAHWWAGRRLADAPSLGADTGSIPPSAGAVGHQAHMASNAAVAASTKRARRSSESFPQASRAFQSVGHSGSV